MTRIDLNNELINLDMQNIYSSTKGIENLKNMSIYITGASGMIASYLTAYLIWLNETYDYNITIFAGIRSREKAKKRFGIYSEKWYFHLIEEDVIMPVPKEKIGEVDYIVHAASLASPQYYGRMPVETMLPNIIGTNELLRYALNDPKLKSFLFFSSGSIYGSVAGIESIKESNLGTLDILNMGNSYAESKRCGETLCRAYYEEYHIPIKSVRIHHTYGPTMDVLGDHRMFTEFVNNIIHSQNIVLTSDGSAKRAFCYITDAIVAYLTILLNGNSGESYNQGNKNAYISVKELADLLVNMYPEKKLKVEFNVRNDSGYKLSPESRVIPLNTSKLELLGWKPTISIEDGFYRTIEIIRQMETDNV